MTSKALRDPLKDPLLTPQNAAFPRIDYQPVQVTESKASAPLHLSVPILRVVVPS